MTPEHLSQTLFYVSQKAATKTLRSTICAVAYLTLDLAASPIITAIQKAMANMTTDTNGAPVVSQREELSTITTKLDSALEQWSTQQEEWMKTIHKIPQIDDPINLLIMEARLQSISEGVATVQTAVEEMKTQKAANTTAANPQQYSYHDTALAPHQPTARTAQANHIDTDQATARAAIKQRQLLIDSDSDHPLIKDDTANDKLAEIFQKALDAMKTETAPMLQIHSLFQLRNQGIVLELSCPEAAWWIKDPARRIRFTEELGGKIRLKDRQYNIVIPFVPILTDLSSPDTARRIEEGNKLPDGSITQIHWIKDPARQERKQRVAHALMSFASPEVANIAIKSGLHFELTYLWLRKDKKEPTRCLKCQRWGHLAKDCKETKDTCSTCGKEHRTSLCRSYQTFYCATCQTDRHASSNRDCPEYVKRQAALDMKTLENAMPYFLTEAHWTQAPLPPRQKTPIVTTKAPTNHPPTPGKNLKQTTLTFTPKVATVEQEDTAEGNASFHSAPASPILPQDPNPFPCPSPLLAPTQVGTSTQPPSLNV